MRELATGSAAISPAEPGGAPSIQKRSVRQERLTTHLQNVPVVRISFGGTDLPARTSFRPCG